MIVKVSYEAINDIAEIKRYIREECCNPAAANRIANKITNKYKLLKTSPYIGAAFNAVADIESDYRYLVCGSYIIFYRILSDHVEVVRIIYGRRDYAKIIFGNDNDIQEDTED